MSTETRDQPPARKIVLTYEDYCLLPDDGRRYEILSSGTVQRDRVEKAQLYARHGVRHYWLVDPEARAIEAFELAEGQYRRTARLAGEATFVPSLFPGLAIPRSSLWG